MANPIFDGPSRRQNSPSIFGRLREIKSILSGNPEQVADQMYQSNPQFREFADKMRGKNPEEAFREQGYDFEQIRKMFGR